MINFSEAPGSDGSAKTSPVLSVTKLSDPANWLTTVSTMWAHGEVTPRKIRFSAVRSPRFSVSGYSTQHDEVECSFFFFIAGIHACSTSKLRQETQYLASILADKFVKCIWRNISRTHSRKTELALGVNSLSRGFHHELHRAMATNADQWKWHQRRISAVSVLVWFQFAVADNKRVIIK